MASTAAKLLTILSNSGIVYQLRADFPVDATAPMGQSPITYNAEVGDLLLYQQNGVAEWRIVGGVAEVTGTGLTALPVMGHPDGFTRTPGLAFKHRTASNPNGGSGTAKVSPTMGWTNLRHSTASNRVTGFDLRRLSMLLAVLEKRCGLNFGNQDVFLNIAGGIKISDPSIDLAVVTALISSLQDIYVRKKICFAGEVGLAGEIRPVSRIEQRIQEAGRLGFEVMYVAKPRSDRMNYSNAGIEVRTLAKVDDLLSEVFA